MLSVPRIAENVRNPVHSICVIQLRKNERWYPGACLIWFRDMPN
jgi:hypothetical protein